MTISISVNQFSRSFLCNFLCSFLCSFSQIMLQRNAVTGLLFIVGIGLNAPIMLIGAAIAVVSALLVAQFFQYDSDSIDSGLYGFNAALVGAAVFLFLPANVFSFTLVILAGAISTVIMHFMLHFTLQRLPDFPVFTAPFLVSIWIILQLSEIFFIETIVIETIAIDVKTPSIIINASSDLSIVIRGVGQVLFQGHWLSGIVCIAGLLLHSYKVAAWAIIGSVGGLIVARMFDFPENLVHQGLYGFNASLTAIALTDRYPKKFFKTRWPVLLGIVISVLLTRAFEYLTMPALTAPFVLASWLVIVLVKIESA